MKKLLALALAVALGLLLALNPSEAEHRARFGAAFRADHPVLSLFGADRVAPSLLAYRSYGVASVGRVGDRVATVGVLGTVRVRELDMEKLGEEAGAQGKQGVKEFLDGVRAGVEGEQ
ncbi:MAG TPA: hypothetical protein VF615_30345 [Longimicrobiaceae bacterium]|jgi:hypothetical protein